MASLREIRRKIKSVKSTEQITKAMKMVAAARMRRSKMSILAARPFAVKMERMVRELALLEMRAGVEAGEGGRIYQGRRLIRARTRSRLVSAAVAVVRVPVAHELFAELAVALESLRLEVRPVRAADLGPLVPVHAQPAQSLEDALDLVPR